MLEKYSQATIEKAVQLLQAAEVVAFPTETVYGLGADARNPEAISKVFAAKGRPTDHPVIVHLADISQVSAWAKEINTHAKTLAEAFWPGPLTLVMQRASNVLDAVTGSQNTVGIRIPAHPVAQHLLMAFGDGLIAPSANRFGHVSPTQALHVHQELADKIPLIIDGGECDVGIESTIIDVSGNKPRLLRPGMISVAQINQLLGENILQSPVYDMRAPGMLASHYAPETTTQLLNRDDLLQTLLKHSTQRIVVLAYSPLMINNPLVEVIAMPQQATVYAHDLYKQLRWADNQNYSLILIEMPPQEDQWLGVIDRLQKAAA